MSEQRFTDELQVLLARSTEPRELLAWSLGWLSTSIRFKGGSIARLNAADELEIVAAFGQIDEAARKVRLARGQGIAGTVVATGKSIYRPDLDIAVPDGAPVAGRAVGTNRLIRSYLCAPLIADGKAVGVIQIDSDRPDAFDAEAVALFEHVARALSASGALI